MDEMVRTVLVMFPRLKPRDIRADLTYTNVGSCLDVWSCMNYVCPLRPALP